MHVFRNSTKINGKVVADYICDLIGLFLEVGLALIPLDETKKN